MPKRVIISIINYFSKISVNYQLPITLESNNYFSITFQLLLAVKKSVKNRSHGLESWLLSYEDKKYVHNCGKNYHGIKLCSKNLMYWKFHCKSLSRKVISNWVCFNYQLLWKKVINYYYQLLSRESNYIQLSIRVISNFNY